MPIGFENSAVRVVQVRPSIEGNPAPGYEISAVTSEPATVEVIGPESSLRGLDEAMTEPMSVANATRPVRELLNIGVADPEVRLRTPQTAEVVVQIVPGASTTTLTRIPVEIRNLASGVRGRVLPATVSVTLRGTKQGIRDLTSEGIDASIDAAGLAPGDHQTEIRVRTGQGFSVDQVSPEVVRLRITKSQP
jgi:YbbR domain-containing protein